MFVRLPFLVVVVVLLLASFVSPWRRRRRRRAPPPPPVNCGVSQWSAWSVCTKKCSIGTHYRTRSVTTNPAFGGRECPVLRENGNCGQANGGCDDRCHEDNGGTCSCTRAGYELQDDKKSCADKDECLDRTAVHCTNSKCRNTDGDYACDCYRGYKTSGPRKCVPKSCTQLTASQCPVDAYRDEFGTTCMPATINCRDGLEYQKSCTLDCASNYRLAVIAQPKSGQKFAQDFSAVDFASPSYITVCSLDPNSDGVLWDWNPVTTPYYCRRVNDPPLNITISTNVINEKQDFLTPVGTLSASDPQNDHLTFSIVNSDGNFHFIIQNNKMLVKVRLVWNPNSTNIYPVVVNVTDSGAPVMRSQTILHIKVMNINDPPYDLKLSNSKVFENVPVNSVVGNLTAIDDDVGRERSSNFSWEVVDSDNGHFSLRENKVLVAKTLDHESKNIHRIQVKCTDFGNPSKSSQVTSMTIIVRDSNDSPKSINLTKHRVDENSPVGTVVGEIVATDDDNDTLLFDLNGTDRIGLEKFSLQGSASCSPRLDNGKSMQTCLVPLVVNGSLDYEQETKYIIWLAVADPGGITRKSFTIYVENVNEKPTDILLSDNKVPENSPGDVIVGEFLVKDPDNKNAFTQTHTCSLVNSNSGDEDAFYISKTGPRSGQRNLLRVKANKDLDFETKRLYNITVLCKDMKLGISKSFEIKITDVNEAPTSIRLSNTNVNESDSSSIFIGTLSAEDPEGTNQTFTYSVRGSFRINGTNRDQLVHDGPIDFERTPVISVNIRVTDNGGLYLEKEFLITITDVNDKPTDIRLETNATLKENDGVNVYISKIDMVDEDSATTASCQLLNSSNNRVTTRGLTLVVGRTKTDYESLDSSKTLQILIKCEDQHGAAVTRWLHLPVDDKNEPPTDIFLKKSEVRENEDNALVGILEIIDEDVGQRHSCTILDNKTSFFIDATVYPPTLKTDLSLDFESSRVNYVNIKCEDIVSNHQQITYSTEKQFKINVIDVNETPQILCKSPFYASTSFSRGSVLGRIQNYDPDNELYYSSKKRNPKGPFEIRKQILNYRFENENISWPFDVTLNGIIYLEKQLTVEEYNESIVFGIRVDDDGTVWERINGSEKYQIKISETKYAVENCSIVITNETEIDIHLSSNTIAENATSGTIIGKLSRQPELDEVTYHILENDNGTTPFEIDHDILKLKLDNSLDYELLPSDKTFPLTISSVHSLAGVFTKPFLIKIQDVNEMPTAICLTSSQPLDDCSVVGYILIEDLDYPDLRCERSMTMDLEKFSSKLSEYTCHIKNGEDSLSNRITEDKLFYIQNSPPRLYLNKTVFMQGDASYNIPILCRSSKHALHILSTTLKVDVKVPDDANCRHNELCARCPEPRFCLTHVKVAGGRCVGKDYRINSTVAIPVSIFEKPGFVSKFEEYVTDLIEGTSQGKTLKDLVQEFNGENQSFRRRRDAVYSDVYVEQFVYVGDETSTNVVFAVAEKPRYYLISASEACKLLMNTEVKCLADDDGNNSAKKGEGDSEGDGFPVWIIYIIAAVLIILVLIIALVVFCRRRANKDDHTATVHFVRDGNEGRIDSMYETPADDRDQGISNPDLVEKRKDIKVFHNPTYRSQRSGQDSDDTEENKKRTFNHYETADPPPLYESIDDDLYEKVQDEKMKEYEEMETKPMSRKKSRSNPVYDVGEVDDELNPVINLAVISPSRKVKKDGSFFPSVLEENDSDDASDILSTFQARNNPGNPYENVGVINPLASCTDDEKAEEEDAKPPSAVLNGHEDLTTSGQAEDSKHPLSMKNDVCPLEHQNSFEVNSDDVPASPPPVYDNNELYSLEKKRSENTADHTFC